EVRDRLTSRGAAADEYVGKPYDAGYVVARGRELMRRAQGKPTILLIEDSPALREELRRALSAGYEVITAPDRAEGLHLAAPRRPPGRRRPPHRRRRHRHPPDPPGRRA